jgi:hypothetical protein
MRKIEPGKVYWVTLDKVRFQVLAIQASAIKDWWHCETVEAGNPVVIRESDMMPAADGSQSPP